MGVFENYSVLLELKNLPIKEKKKLKSAVTENGGNICFVVNEQVRGCDNSPSPYCLICITIKLVKLLIFCTKYMWVIKLSILVEIVRKTTADINICTSAHFQIPHLPFWILPTVFSGPDQWCVQSELQQAAQHPKIPNISGGGGLCLQLSGERSSSACRWL